MRVKFFSYIRDYTACSETEISLIIPTIGGMAQILCERYGAKFREEMLAEDGDLNPNIVVMVNGRHVVHLGGINAPLKEDDAVHIFPVAAGG